MSIQHAQASHHRAARLPARKDLRRTFEQTAKACETWQEFRRRVGRLIGTATRNRERCADWRASAWRTAGSAWADVHPDIGTDTLH